jgi:hypothetical protein
MLFEYPRFNTYKYLTGDYKVSCKCCFGSALPASKLFNTSVVLLQLQQVAAVLQSYEVRLG